MPGTLLVGAENVILVPDQAYASSRPIPEGLELVLKLRTFPITRTIVMVGTQDAEAALHFCRLNGLPTVDIDTVLPEDEDLDSAEAQWNLIQRRRAGGPIPLVITAYPRVYQLCTTSHQPVLLYGRRGGLYESEGQPSWDELHNRVTKHREALAAVSDRETDYS